MNIKLKDLQCPTAKTISLVQFLSSSDYLELFGEVETNAPHFSCLLLVPSIFFLP